MTANQIYQTANQIYQTIPRDQQAAALLVLAAFRFIESSQAPTAPTAPTGDRKMDPEREARLRAKIVSDVWEPDLRSELIDRIVDARSTGLIDAPTLKAAIRKALDSKREYELTGGNRGRDANWKTLATWLKGVYDANGIEWTPTNGGFEPRPSETPLFSLAERLGLASDEDVKPSSGRLDPGSLKELADNYRAEANA